MILFENKQRELRLTTMQSDYNFILALSVEQFLDRSNHLTRNAFDGWQLFLAEARKNFLVDELLTKNHLDTSSLDGEILEFDGGVSRLREVFKRSNIRTHQARLSAPFEINGTFGLAVSHNQLEHLSSLDAVDEMLAFMRQKVVFGMVHQVHAEDEL